MFWNCTQQCRSRRWRQMISLLGETPSLVSCGLTRPCRSIRKHSKKIQSLVQPGLRADLFTITGHITGKYSATLKKQNKTFARESFATRKTYTLAHRFVILCCKNGTIRHSLNPKRSKSLAGLALGTYKLGQKKEALTFLSEAIRLDPNYRDPAYLKARNYWSNVAARDLTRLIPQLRGR